MSDTLQTYKETIDFIRKTYGEYEKVIPLHVPVFAGNEKKYLEKCIDTTFVSYVGEFVGKFEQMICEFTGSKYAVAMVNGTCALEIALKIAEVKSGDEVLTQALTFVATSNAIAHCGATPVFIDSDIDTLGLSVEKLEEFLSKQCEIRDDGFLYNKVSANRIAACVPVHIFGHPSRIDRIVEICNKFNICVVEDAAESIGGYYKGKHTGTFGKLGILSFNGNKTITTGGGGMILTDEEKLAMRAKHISTTAKIPHPWEFAHDEVGYNYRITNLNAAVGCAQMEKIDFYLKNKRELAGLYEEFFKKTGIDFFTEKKDCMSNYWLNCIFLKTFEEREMFLKYTNENGVMTRPVWRLMNKLPMYKNCFCTNLDNAKWLEERLVNIPSSVRI